MAPRTMFTSKPLALVSLAVLVLLLSTICVRNMERVNFNYSLKNIPVPSQKDYLLELTNSVGIFISNIRWRSHFFLNPSDHNKKETYNFKSSKAAPQIAELKEFEEEIYDIVKSVTFKHGYSTELQSTLKNDMKKMKNDDKIYAAADKTTNFYKMSPEKYEDLKHKNITKEYKKSTRDEVKTVNDGDKNLAEQLELDDRIYSLNKKDCFITVKDHKDNYENNTKCRLLNPSKSELGKVSKIILSKIVKIVKEKTNYNHWQNTSSVLTHCK